MWKKLISFPVLMAAPVQLLIWFVVIFPTIVVVWLAFCYWTPQTGKTWWHADFVGIENFLNLLSDDPRFIWSIIRTVIIFLVCMSVELVGGMVMALLFQRNFLGKKLLVSVLIVPMMVIPLVIGQSFYMLFLAQGPFNQIISWLTFSNFQFDWLSHPVWAMVPIMLGEIWNWTPLVFLIFMSGLTTVPENQIRAAQGLGATPAQIFFRISLPILKPLILLVIVIRGMEIFKIFDLVYVLTGGGPGNSTETITMYMYNVGIAFMRVSYVAASSFIVLFLVVIGAVRILKPLQYQLLED
ncbi:MAG: sugar ABC transporter permease [Desulfobacterales bacterium]|nr:MAG: sugar ABC transporter permease [Desulfobacterales bacterium]